MSTGETLVVRMGWVAYLRSLLLIVLLIGFTSLYISHWAKIHAFFLEVFANAPSFVSALIMIIPLIAFTAGVIKEIWQLLLNRSVAVMIGPNGVAYRSGILPWKRRENFWRYDQIYQAKYSNRPEFWGWVFRFGDLIITGREGSTREYRIAGLHNPKRAQQLISSQTKE